MRRGFIFILLCVLPLTAWAQNREFHRDRLIAACKELDDCLEILGRTLPDKDTGGINDREVKEVARILSDRFGPAAKDALLDKAVGDHEGWRNFAGAVLMYWKDWSEEDVPRLARALRLQSGGWIAHPLGKIGSPAAIEALIADLPYAGFESQTGWVLSQLAPEKVMPFLLPVLELPEQLIVDGFGYDGRRAAMDLIPEFGAEAAIIAPDWTRIARSTSEGKERRLAALRGLAAIGEHAARQWGNIRPLLNADNEDIASQAMDTLVAMHDPNVAVRFAAACPAGLDQFEQWHGIETLVCLRTLSEFGAHGRSAGPLLIERLGKARNGAEMAYLIETLGLIGYEPAADMLEEFLDTDDWRAVYAALRSLGWLEAKQSLSGIEKIEREHWLPEIQELARLVRMSFDTNKPFKEPTQAWEKLTNRNRVFGNYGVLLPRAEECSGLKWNWAGTTFTFRKKHVGRDVDRRILDLNDGKLVGTDKGEWIGSLEWKAQEGKTQTLVKDNVIALLKTSRGPVAVFGLSHMFSTHGYAVGLKRAADGSWELYEVARFTAATYLVRSLGNDLFAAYADDNRVFIFTPDGIQGLAKCAATE